MMVMSSNSLNVIIQFEVLHTLRSIIKVLPLHTSDLIFNAGMNEIMNTMEKHIKKEYIQEYCCGLFALSETTKRHAHILGMCNSKFILSNVIPIEI